MLIKNGIKLLNKKYPGWQEKIDIDTLNLKSCTECILGQLYSDFDNGRDHLGIEDYEASSDRDWETWIFFV